MTQDSGAPKAASQNNTNAAASKARSLRLDIFVYNVVIIGVLAGIAYLFETNADAAKSEFAVYIISAWFGALGGVMISLKDIYDHAADKWDNSFVLWHAGRPLSGAVAGFMTVILLAAVVSKPKPDDKAPPLAIYAAAFILGTQERRFFNLLSEVARLVVQVPDETKEQGLKVTDITPAEGSAGTVVVVKGQGIEAGATVKLGSAALEKPVIATDGTFAAGAVPARVSGADATVDVTVSNSNGISFVLPKKFKYTN